MSYNRANRINNIKNIIHYLDDDELSLVENIYKKSKKPNNYYQLPFLNNQCINYILSYLNDIDYIHFISINKFSRYNLCHKPLNSTYKISNVMDVLNKFCFKYIIYDFKRFYNSCVSNSITHLTLGHEFNNPIDNLPNSITHSQRLKACLASSNFINEIFNCLLLF
jgi:hypothetical protein